VLTVKANGGEGNWGGGGGAATVEGREMKTGDNRATCVPGAIKSNSTLFKNREASGRNENCCAVTETPLFQTTGGRDLRTCSRGGRRERV